MESPINHYYNARVLHNHNLVVGDLWEKNGIVIPPQNHADNHIDLQHKILAPGYIDIQINGAFGIDFSTDPDKVLLVAEKLPQYGVTSFYPTLVSLHQSVYKQYITSLNQQMGSTKGSSILGIHLEGPFFSPQQYGAHDPHNISDMNYSISDCYGILDGVKIITLAPEIPGALEAIRCLKETTDIVVSAGHTKASMEDALLAVDAGVTLATHLFNTMTPIHHRNPGIIPVFLTYDDIFYTVIADNVHVHPMILKLMYKANPEGLVLITDAIQALGMSPGQYQLGNMNVTVNNDKATITDTNTIAGSVLSLDKAVRNLVSATGCSQAYAIEAASLKPAQALNLSSKGNLNVGSDADFIILDDDLFVEATYVSGKRIWVK
jgi:N-acetylglucosamine-6-phosphate deacetylase